MRNTRSKSNSDKAQNVIMTVSKEIQNERGMKKC
nr:MAG TPA: hypothetical protein [Caudoviricetes sp.]